MASGKRQGTWRLVHIVINLPDSMMDPKRVLIGLKIRQFVWSFHLFFLVSSCILMGFLGVLIIPKWLIVDSQTDCNTFWKIFGTSNMDPRTPYLLQKYFNEYKKIWKYVVCVCKSWYMKFENCRHSVYMF